MVEGENAARLDHDAVEGVGGALGVLTLTARATGERRGEAAEHVIAWRKDHRGGEASDQDESEKDAEDAHGRHGRIVMAWTMPSPRTSGLYMS